MMNLYKQRRVGEIVIPHETLRNREDDVLRAIFTVAIPMESECYFFQDATRFLCVSEQFDPVPEGTIIPEYRVIIAEKPDSFQIIVGFERIT